MNTRDKNRSSERGFSLLEISISLIIIGILMGTFGTMYSVYKKREVVNTTEDNAKVIIRALADYRLNYGRYPTPASLSAPKGDVNYGIEHPDELVAAGPTIQGMAFGTCDLDGDGDFDLCVEQSANDPLDRNNVINRRVYRGAVPFKTLNIDEEQAYDGYGSRIFYAVTEVQTDVLSSSPNNGGILIVDNQLAPASLRVDADGNDAYYPYLLFTPGADKLGAHNSLGVLLNACVGVTADVENCNTLADSSATYKSTAHSEVAGANHFDDYMNYFQQTDFRYWAKAATNENIISTGADAFAMGNALDPDYTIDLGNDSGAQMTADAGGNVRAQQYCEEGDATCDISIQPRYFSEGEEVDRDGDGDADDPNFFTCPDGTYAKTVERDVVDGFETGLKCEAVDSVGCPDGQVITGFNRHDDGVRTYSSPICEEPPPEGCLAMEWIECGEAGDLPDGEHGDEVSLSFGDSYVVDYTCKDGVWSPEAERDRDGLCVCEPMYQQRDCPVGLNSEGSHEIWVDWCVDGDRDGIYEYDSDDCSCEEGEAFVLENTCGEGLTRTTAGWAQWSCTGGEFVPGEIVETIAQECRCVPQDPETRDLCTEDYQDGDLTETREFVCDPDNLEDPGEWVIETTGSCSCTGLADMLGGTETCDKAPISMPSGTFTGSFQRLYEFECATEEYEDYWDAEIVNNTCACVNGTEKYAYPQCDDMKDYFSVTQPEYDIVDDYHSGYSGSTKLVKTYDCASKEWSDWGIDTNNCSCSGDGATRDVAVANCSVAGFPAHYVGNIDRVEQYSCDDGEWEATGAYVNSTCRKPDEDILQYVVPDGATWRDGYGGTIFENAPCTDGEEGDWKVCNATSDGEGVNADCKCQVTGQETFPAEAWPYTP